MSSSSSESDNAEQAEGSITFATVCKDAREGNKDNDATVKTTFQLKIKAGKKIPVGKTEHKLEGSQFTILVERKESSWFIIYCHSKDEKEFYSRTSTTISLVGSRTYRRECNDEIARVFAENNHVVYIQLGFCKKQPSMIYQSKVLEDLWNNAKTMDFTLISKDAMETHCHSAVLKCLSPYFEKALNTVIGDQKNKSCLNIEFSHDVVRSIIQFAYKGTMGIVPIELAFQLLEAAHMMELPVEFLQNLKLSFKIIPYDKFSQTYRLILVAQDSEWGSSDHVLAISQIRQQLDSQIRADPVKLYTWSLKRKNMDPAESSPSKKLNCSVLVSSKDSKDQKDHKS